ncbi:uncharacterized protein N7484_007627 [Penicillium longicatenatum]|uniref:uncharacterized protein n=1 Tax=Penicillium longicatenatum TaxID=1561947 RepID=UPI0025483EBB|nr:uncharacterized protein N7484_007627 [Penicillium longicatenatum]KAJ5639765.1 hypothetical protein N7484_007627 [Penicillium longicatenatum]
MVSLFMVISGYAISLALLRTRDSSATGVPFFRHLSSTATRRIFRIYLPSTLVVVISQLVFFLGTFQLDSRLPDQFCAGLKPLSTPWYHTKYAFWTVLHSFDISNHGADMNFNTYRPDIMKNLSTHLWTMPVEYRGSCTVYLCILVFSFWRQGPRRLAILAVTSYWFYIGQWDLLSFIGGLFLAELHVASENPEADGEVQLSCDDQTKDNFAAWKLFITSPHLRLIRTIICFVFGVYLLCIAAEQELSIEHRWLLYIQPGYWDNPEMMTRSWRSVGALIVIYAISQSSYLQYPLNCRPVQYLGKISFPLYLVHPTIYNTIKRPLRNILWGLITQQTYPGTEEAINYSLLFGSAWGVATLVCAVIMVVVAHFWEMYIDKKCLQLSRRFDKWASQ